MAIAFLPVVRSSRPIPLPPVDPLVQEYLMGSWRLGRAFPMMGITWRALSGPALATAGRPSVPGACCLTGIPRERDRRFQRVPSMGFAAGGTPGASITAAMFTQDSGASVEVADAFAWHAFSTWETHRQRKTGIVFSYLQGLSTYIRSMLSTQVSSPGLSCTSPARQASSGMLRPLGVPLVSSPPRGMEHQ